MSSSNPMDTSRVRLLLPQQTKGENIAFDREVERAHDVCVCVCVYVCVCVCVCVCVLGCWVVAVSVLICVSLRTRHILSCRHPTSHKSQCHG